MSRRRREGARNGDTTVLPNSDCNMKEGGEGREGGSVGVGKGGGEGGGKERGMEGRPTFSLEGHSL